MPARRFATESRSTRPSRGRSTTRYDRLVQIGALSVGLCGCALIWLLGSYFTLSWLASLGFHAAAAGLLPIHTVLHIGPAEARLTWSAVQSLWLSILGAWTLPLAMTLIETGFDPARTSGRHSRLIWGVFLGLDAVTSALGLQAILVRFVPDVLVSWALAVIIGLLLAVVPEKLARRLIVENL